VRALKYPLFFLPLWWFLRETHRFPPFSTIFEGFVPFVEVEVGDFERLSEDARSDCKFMRFLI
jgi:hypothetical protein